jgi:hypothetical protein
MTCSTVVFSSDVVCPFQLQEKKRELTKAALSGDKMKNNKLGINDLMALFRPGGRDEEEE